MDSRPCDQCGKTYQPKRRGTKFCGHACAQAASSRAGGDAEKRGHLSGRLKQLDELLVAKGIDLADLDTASMDEVKVYQQGYKDADGVGQVQNLMSVTISPSWEKGPEWPVITPGPAITIPKFRIKRKCGKWKTAVVIPDIQAGYFRRVDDSLEPIHDEAAIEVAIALVVEADPDIIVLVGDNLDLAEFGRFGVTPAYARTTQAQIDWMTRFLARLRIAAPNAEIIWIAGNHEERLPKFIMQNAMAAMGIRQGDAPDTWPVMSVPHLCRMDDFGVTYVPGYPAAEYWITKRLRVIHGDIVKSGGSTAHGYLAREKTSVIYGHIHRREWAERTRDDHDGPRTTMAASPGCLCRTDGAVPSTKGGTDLDGRPVQRTEDWQQGIAVVDFDPESGWFSYDQVPIHQGWARWRGQDYRATVDATGKKLAA